MAATLDEAIGQIRAAQKAARDSNTVGRPRWPMIVLRSPRLDGPKEIRDTRSKAHGARTRCPSATCETCGQPEAARGLDALARGAVRCRRHARATPEALLRAEPADERQPARQWRVAAQTAQAPGFRKYAVKVSSRGTSAHENTKPLGEFLRDVLANNPTNFRVFGPDETASNDCRPSTARQGDVDDLDSRGCRRRRVVP